MKDTYHRRLEPRPVLLHALDGVADPSRPVHQLAGPRLADVLEDGADLVARRRLLGHVELPVAPQVQVVPVVRGLVLGRGRVLLRRELLEQGGGAPGGGDGGPVEEGDDIEGLVLWEGMSLHAASVTAAGEAKEKACLRSGT